MVIDSEKWLYVGPTNNRLNVSVRYFFHYFNSVTHLYHYLEADYVFLFRTKIYVSINRYNKYKIDIIKLNIEIDVIDSFFLVFFHFLVIFHALGI